MKKVLTLIIPTYNMEALLPRCLDSLVGAKGLDLLDIIIVNDGSRDGSLRVARDYELRYPESIQVIDKPNGNYGSTINAALPAARGKYVKILDSDDSFYTDALDSYLRALSSLEADADISVTHFHMFHQDGSIEKVKYDNYGREPYEYDRIYPLDEVLSGGYIRYFLMHSLAYRTDMLRSFGYKQTEGISYTDIQWDTYPLFHAQSIVFHDLTVYRYNLDRAGQTMDPAVIRKSLPQMERMTLALLEHYRQEDLSALSPARIGFLKQYYRNRVRLLVKTHLMDIPREEFDPERFAGLDALLQDFLSEAGMDRIRLYPANKLIRVDAYAWWCRRHSRLPVWLERVNGRLDKLMTWLFVRLYH